MRTIEIGPRQRVSISIDATPDGPRAYLSLVSDAPHLSLKADEVTCIEFTESKQLGDLAAMLLDYSGRLANEKGTP